MANSGAGISSDAAQTSGDEYQVFLSFRGSDTRHGFTDFLYHGLMDAGVRVFKDDDEHRVGEVIGENLLHTMNNAILYIPIFSQTYASSIWCLQELAFMVDHVSKSEVRKSILPIFLDVEPEDVKLRTPLYRAAFEKHKENFPDEVEAWRKALAEVDEIKGWNVEKDQSQATIVKLVVEKVLEKLEIKQKSVVKHIVGLDDRVKYLTELSDVDHQDVRFIEIYGKGGIGKTTVAKVIFDKLSFHFEKCCSFLENVRESWLTKEGKVQLQRKLLSDIVGSGSAEQLMDNEQAMRRIGDTLSTKKVLIVLDDVDKKEHVNKIIGGYSLHSGSRIIITTRNKIVLNAKGLKAEIIYYEMLKMDDAPALQLFYQHAFNREFPSDIYHRLSSKIVSIIGGLPLAIEVIGSLLNGKDEAFWKETLVRLRKVPDEDIMEMLRISYDNLDRYQQQIFLDVACFLFNENKTEAIYMWADCQFYPIRGLKVITDRCLIKISDNDKIWMHDHLIDLGRRIVRQESPFNPGKRSRLWTVQEALEIMRTKKRKDDVQALKIYRSGDSIEITDEEFERLQNLRLLELNWGTYAGDFARCHSNLRWFSWHSPQDFRADNMYLKRLVVCKLDTIDFKDDSKAWDLIKKAQNLKVLSITRCSGITRIPNFSKCSRLERLTLANCFSLERIESFIGDLGSLTELKIEQCQSLRDLPEELGALMKLKHLSFSGCGGLRELPGSLGNLTSLIELNLSGTSIAKSPGLPLLGHAQEISLDTSNLESKLDKTKTEGGDKATSRWQVVRRWMTSRGSYNKEKEKYSAGMSSDVAGTAGGEYQVFLSFRGPDTHNAFTDFLYKDLVEVGLRVFMDDDELRAGDMIKESLLCAINSSTIYIPVFSGTYAVSKWCLWELAHIVDNVSKSEGQKSVLPIFFHVEPEDVKLKTTLYRNALLEHAKKFPNEVEAWRAALEQVGKIKGWNVRKDQRQAAIIVQVVEEVLKKLKTKQKEVPDYLIGLDDRVKDLTSFLDVNHDDVRLVGIYGMGGIGKTTIAKVIFNQLHSHFGKCCSFLEDVREKSSTKEGIVQLQTKLLSDIAGRASIKDCDEGMRMIGEIISKKKVLVVLDDVNEKQHIKKLIGNSKLHSRSRVIITTRDKDVLEVNGFKGEIKQYEMQNMENHLAFELFRQHAFGGDLPSNDYRGLSKKIVSRMGGLPLAITVIGSLLKGKEKGFWEETLDRLNKALDDEISEILRISYDTLDKYQKEIFLDIACFFFNEEIANATYMWDDCQFYPIRAIAVLTKRCLIKILDNDKFWMHDLLIALGRKIVHEKSGDDIGKKSRSLIAEETAEIIKIQKRKPKVQALHNTTIEISNEEFKNLPELRFLDLLGGTFVGDFARCTSKLRWLSWSSWSFPRGDLKADKMHLDRLVVCKLSNIDFMDDSKAWDFIKCAGNLKVLSIKSCGYITMIPDISQCSGLERLTLEWCSGLKRIESFIGNLRSLVGLKIENCYSLAYLPQEIGALVKLEHFSLSGCRNLKELPGSIENLTSLAELNLSDTSIGELPKSIGKLKSLRILHFKGVLNPSKENHVWQLPSGISMLVNLEELDISWQLRMNGKIPIGIGELSYLRILRLSKTGICEIPSTIKMLHRLQTLDLSDCDAIQELPELPPSLTSLYLPNSLRSVPNLGNLTNLVELGLGNGFPYEGQSSPITGGNLRWIGQLSRLKRLFGLQVPPPPELASLSHLEELSLYGLDREALKQLPRNLSTLRLNDCEVDDVPLPRNLSTLFLYDCEVGDIPSDGLQQLEDLYIYSCDRIQRLSIPSKLSKLRHVTVFECAKLVETRVAGLLESLESFSISKCKSLTRISGLSHSKNLENLDMAKCGALTDVEGLDELESLKSLKVRDCPSLRRLIDASCTKIPDDCEVSIWGCADSIINCDWFESLKDYRRNILENPTKKVDIESEEDYGEEMMKMFTEELTTKTDLHSEEDGGELKTVGSGNRRQRRVGGTGTGCTSKPGRDPADRGRARSMTSSSRDGKGSRSGKDAAFTSGKSTASNTGRAIASSSRSGMTSSSGRGRVSTPGRGTTKMGASLRSGTDEGSSSAKVKAGTGNRRQMRVGETGTGCASKPGRDSADRGRARSMTSSSRDGKGSRSGKEAAFTSGKSTASNSGRAIASNSRSNMTLSSGRGRVSTPGTGTTLSSGRGTIKMGASLRSGTDEGSSSAQAEPQTSGHDKNNKANTSRQGSKQKI